MQCLHGPKQQKLPSTGSEHTQNPKGETFTLSLWQMMVQPPNHNTHHRGELAAMLALMNISHPEEEIVQ